MSTALKGKMEDRADLNVPYSSSSTGRSYGYSQRQRTGPTTRRCDMIMRRPTPAGLSGLDVCDARRVEHALIELLLQIAIMKGQILEIGPDLTALRGGYPRRERMAAASAARGCPGQASTTVRTANCTIAQDLLGPSLTISPVLHTSGFGNQMGMLMLLTAVARLAGRALVLPPIIEPKEHAQHGQARERVQ
eukprot:2864359-Pleurochrysis_carterae.AAC.3